jgi:hypothetical protein
MNTSSLQIFNSSRRRALLLGSFLVLFGVGIDVVVASDQARSLVDLFGLIVGTLISVVGILVGARPPYVLLDQLGLTLGTAFDRSSVAWGSVIAIGSFEWRGTHFLGLRTSIKPQRTPRVMEFLRSLDRPLLGWDLAVPLDPFSNREEMVQTIRRLSRHQGSSL